MGLLANGFRDNGGLYLTSGATVSNNAYPSAIHNNRCLSGSKRNLTFGEGITTTKAGVPDGYTHPASYLLPMKAGAMSSHNNLTGEGTMTDADAWAVRLAEAAISGDGSLTAFGGLVVQLVAAITGSGTVTNADIKAFLAAVAALTGSGTISSAVRTGLGELLAATTGSGTAGGSTATGIGELDADIVAYGDLTPEGIRDAILNAIIESGLSLSDVQRILLSFAAGNATGLEGADPKFYAQDGTTVRIDGAYSAGNRTIDSLNGD